MHMWDTIFEGRDALSWQRGRHSIKFGGSYRWYVWPMWALVQSRGYYSFTSGFTTQTATSDGTGSALASFLLGLPASRQLQAGVPTMDLRQWSADAFLQDTWRISPHTTLEAGLRYEFMSPLVDLHRQWSNLLPENGRLTAFIGGQNGMPRGLMYPSKLRFAPRLGLAHHFEPTGVVLRAAYGIFFTPVDLNTWCNQLHNVPLVFPITQQSDNFVPGLNGFNFSQPVLGATVVSFTAFDPHSAAQYVQQWSASVQKTVGRDTTLETGYHGERGFHLQRSHLINNAPPGPGPLQPRRPYQRAQFLPGTVFPPNVTVASDSFPVSTVNMLENTAQSWYNAGYVNLRRRYSKGLSLLANYTFAKNLSDAPDFRSPMFESAIPQNNGDLRAEKGPACDIRHRFALKRGVRCPRGRPRAVDARRDAGLAALDHLPGPERLSVHDFGLRRHGQRRNGSRRKPHSRKPHGPAGLRPRDPHGGAVVQSGGVRNACGLQVRRCGPEYGIRAQLADHGPFRGSLVPTHRGLAARNAR